MKLKVYISSSEGRSNAIAAILREYLPLFIQAVDPYSSEDIPVGARTVEEKAAALAKIKISIICLTSENLKDPGILFDAGALFSKSSTKRICPLLFGVKNADVEGPLANFQAAEFGKKEMHRVLEGVWKVISLRAASPLAESWPA